MPLQATSGAASYDAFGGGVPVVPAYIEEVFSTYLYTGTGSAQTITNAIDLSTKGGLVWIKDKTTGGTSYENALTDTVRGATNEIQSDTTAAQTTNAARLTSFNSNGFSIGNSVRYNQNTDNYVSWTFAKQPKFFDVVTYTGTGSNTTIAHNLGSVPACIMVKRTDSTGDWQVYHRSLANTEYLVLNSTAAKATGATRWNSTTPTSTVFSLGTDATVNASGGTYVAYIFAHDAGGFGLTGTDNVISCGSFTSDGTGLATVNLGYEAQWVLVKNTTSVEDWQMYDVMRGMSFSSAFQLNPNLSAAESNVGSNTVLPTSTGFTFNAFAASQTGIYIAIRRGPMAVPTTGTSVFGLSARTGTGANETITGGQTDDAVLVKSRGSAVADLISSRLTGTGYLVTSSTAAEVAAGATILQANPWDVMDGVKVGTTSTITNASGNTFINYLFKRAPSFMDVVCYTGNDTAGRTVTHNLGVTPELMIVKSRNNAIDWPIYNPTVGADKYLLLNGSASPFTGTTIWNDTSPTSSVFSVGTDNSTNFSTWTYVAYLFATCAGVSKIGSYTGTATTKQIDCGFTGGARFVLIKRIDASGAFYVWDTARGIVAGNDPYFLLNSTAAEVTNTDYIDTYSAGFEISSTAPAAINASGGTFIFLAIA